MLQYAGHAQYTLLLAPSVHFNEFKILISLVVSNNIAVKAIIMMSK